MKYLYHGSVTPDIKELEPRKRYTPGVLGDDVLPSVYATDDPAYAAAHSFPWGTNEGFDLDYENGHVKFIVPEKYRDRLKVEVYIYKIPAESFKLLEEVEPIGHNFSGQERVSVTECEKFDSVTEAVEHYGGVLEFKELEEMKKELSKFGR